MSLADTIDKVYDAMENGEGIDFNKIGPGKAFARRLMTDLLSFRSMMESCDVSLDNRGWLHNNPFAVTVEILNRQETPGEEVHVRKGHKNTIVVYYGICPELENFTNIVLWPQSKTSNVAYRKIYDLVTGDSERKMVLRFSKKYGLQLPNTIHPANDDEIDTIKKPHHVYDWEHAPYLKDTGDTLLSHTSPLNYKKVYLDENKSIKSYVNLKVTIGRIEALGKSQIKMLIPSFYGSWLNYNSRILEAATNRKLEIGSLYYFLIMERLDGNVEDVVMLTSPASPTDLIGHMLSMALYNLRLREQRLKVVTRSGYNKLYEKCLSTVRNFCKKDDFSGSNMWTSENIFYAYLSPYFRMVEDVVFFLPNNQSDIQDQILELYDKKLSQNASSISDGRGLIFDDEGMKINLRPHGRIYQLVKLTIGLKRFLMWNEARENLCDRLLTEIRIREEDSNS